MVYRDHSSFDGPLGFAYDFLDTILCFPRYYGGLEGTNRFVCYMVISLYKLLGVSIFFVKLLTEVFSVEGFV